MLKLLSDRFILIYGIFHRCKIQNLKYYYIYNNFFLIVFTIFILLSCSLFFFLNFFFLSLFSSFIGFCLYQVLFITSIISSGNKSKKFIYIIIYRYFFLYIFRKIHGYLRWYWWIIIYHSHSFKLIYVVMCCGVKFRSLFDAM